MRVLQAQINPHFVFNSLNDLQYYINKGDTNTSLTYVSRFSRFIRELITQANEPEITLAQEEQFLKLYLDLEKMRFAGKRTEERRGEKERVRTCSSRGAP